MDYALFTAIIIRHANVYCISWFLYRNGLVYFNERFRLNSNLQLTIRQLLYSQTLTTKAHSTSNILIQVSPDFFFSRPVMSFK